MNILAASDSFKGCMSSHEANEQIKKGILAAEPSFSVRTFAISDGGEGMVQAYCQAVHGQMRHTRTVDLYGYSVEVQWAYDPCTKTACVEAASCLGLTLYDRMDRRPLAASSRGLGLLMKTVLREDVRTLIVGLGGTGTNDGGMGLLEAFGAVFYDRNRQVLEPCARNLGAVAFIDKRHFHFPRSVNIIAACDVQNPLLGENGATIVFGRQKGLRQAEREKVDWAMGRFAAKISQTFHRDMSEKPGSGAAGGLGGLLQSVFHARMISGIDLLDQMGGLSRAIEHCDLLITGEGQTDAQTLCGKAVWKLTALARERNKPVIVISGALGPGFEELYRHGVCGIFSTADRAMSFQYALKEGPAKLEQTAFSVGRLCGTLKEGKC